LIDFAGEPNLSANLNKNTKARTWRGYWDCFDRRAWSHKVKL